MIIPCYRQAHFLPTAVDCALAQTYPHIEVIVVNDGSDDNTHDVVLSYGDRLRYVQKTNGGLSSARNAGIAAAQGKYLHFLDADDMLHLDAIGWLVTAMEGREDRLALMGWRCFQESPDAEDSRERTPPGNSSGFPLLVHSNLGPPNCLLSPRELIQQVNAFDETLTSCEDWDLWIRMTLAGAGLATVRKVGAYYRRHEGSMSTHSRRMLTTRTRVLLNTHRAVLNRTDLLAALGPELLEAEFRVVRRWLANRWHSGEMDQLVAAIAELDRHGFASSRSVWRRSLDAVSGYRLERLVVTFYKWFKPEQFDAYRNGCN